MPFDEYVYGGEMQVLPLNESASVRLNAFGDGTASIGPTAHGVTWQAQVASVSVQAPVTNEAQCTLYVGSTATDDNKVDATFTGSSGNSSAAVSARGSRMSLGQKVWAVWHNGDPGALATLVVTGELTLEG